MADENAKETTGRDILEFVEARRSELLDEARADAIERQHKLGKLSARERITSFVDKGSFVEVGAFAEPAHETDFTKDIVAPADGVVTGHARVDGRPVGMIVGDFTVLGGSMALVGGMKCEEIARGCRDNGYPMVMLWDGGGHRIQEALDSRHFALGATVGVRYSTMAQMSGWVPMVSAILGPGFAGPANYASMCDFVVAVREIATIGIAGPALVKFALGEDVTKESIGAAELQANEYGVVDLVCDTEAEAMEAIQRFLSYLPSNAGLLPPIAEVGPEDAKDRRDEELVDLVPANTRKAYDVRKVIALLADRDSVMELKPGYAKNIVTSFIRLGGRPVGVIANQPMQRAGTIDTPATEKAARFVSMCDAFGVPLLYLIDTPGILVGSAAEKSGLIRRHARMMYELGQATVPRMTVVLRKGYGIAYIMMNGGREFMPDVNLIWPTAEICGMQIEGAVDVAHRREVAAAEDPDAKRAEIIADYRKQVGPIQAASGFGVDDVVDPRDTRARLIEVLERAAPRRPSNQPPKHHGISPI